jgi:NAD(P)-dependent dehydrogenase (short-subunit alcohol dehydrogenase family)
MRIALADVEQAALAETAEELRANGAQVLEAEIDVGDAKQVQSLADRTVEQFGAIHVACNNAGVGTMLGPVWSVPVAEWQWVLGVNFWGVLHGIQAFVPPMLEQGEGHVVNTGSIVGLMPGGASGGPYSISKHAVVALSEALFFNLQDAGAPIGVSVLCPGWARTRIVDSDRNRPTDLAPPASPEPVAERVFGAMRQLAAAGMDPAQIADNVRSAILDNRFYVLPHHDDAWLAPIRTPGPPCGESSRTSPTPAGSSN